MLLTSGLNVTCRKWWQIQSVAGWSVSEGAECRDTEGVKLCMIQDQSFWKITLVKSAEAEYIAACAACKEAVWLRKLLASLSGHQIDVTVIFCDNQSCVKFSKNPVFHDRSKHIDMKYHYIRDIVQKGVVKLQYISTDEQVADIFTKPLTRVKFAYFREWLGVMENIDKRR